MRRGYPRGREGNDISPKEIADDARGNIDKVECQLLSHGDEYPAGPLSQQPRERGAGGAVLSAPVFMPSDTVLTSRCI